MEALFTPSVKRNARQGYPVANVASLDEALKEASVICFACDPAVEPQAVIYGTSDRSVADPVTEERYLVFRADDPTRYHLNPEQGWSESYTVTGKRS